MHPNQFSENQMITLDQMDHALEWEQVVETAKGCVCSAAGTMKLHAETKLSKCKLTLVPDAPTPTDTAPVEQATGMLVARIKVNKVGTRKRR